jgi:hypothetical protein
VVLSRIVALVVPLVIGGLVGSIIGGIVTGNEDYAIVWGVFGPIVVTALVLVGVGVTSVKAARKKRAASAPGAPEGINETVTGITQKDVAAVLNPSSSATPSTGVVLNGEPVDGATTTVTAAPNPARPVRLRRWLAIVLLLVGVTIALIPARTMLGWVGYDILHGRPFDGRDMRDGLHLDDAVAEIAEVIGSPDMSYINFYDDYVIVTARTSPRSTTADTYMWRSGKAYRSGPGGYDPELASQLFDSSKLDFSIIPELITIAKRDSGLNDAEDYYPSVRRNYDAERPDDPVIFISLSNDYFSASYTFSFEGEILDKSGSAFE